MVLWGMRHIISFSAAALLALASTTLAAGTDPKAEAVLKAAREALGGDARVAAVTSIVASGSHRRTIGDTQIEGETEITIALPGKYLRSQTDQMFGSTVTMESGFEGDEPVQRSNSVGGGPNVFIRMAGPGGPEADPATVKAMQLRAQRAELARLALGWLASVPSFLEPVYSYAGEAESPDGRAHVLTVTGKDQFSAKLFLDQQTHRPLMLTYTGRQPVMRVMRGGPGAEGARPRQPSPGSGHTPAAGPEIPAPPPMVEIQVYFDDYRKAGDLWLPHRLSRSIDGETVEEIQFNKIQVK